MTSGFYNSAPGDTLPADDNHMIFFRDDPDVLQAGSTNNTNSGGGYSITSDDAYDPNLVYTSADVLALAKSGSQSGTPISDNDNSQFFITNQVEPSWDFRYPIIGYMVRGDALRQTIAGLHDDHESHDRHVAAQ